MLAYNVQFPVTSGELVTAIATGLAASGQPYASGVAVLRKRPAVMPQRLVTVRDDGGQDSNTIGSRRQGINVWAESPLYAEKLAILCAAILRKYRGTGVAQVQNFSSAFEVEDDPALTFNGALLSHFYFTATAQVRATDF